MAKLTGFNILLVLFVSAGGFTYGFAFSVFVSSVGQPGFYEYFGLKSGSAHAASLLGAINALFYAGAGFGAIGQTFFADWIGRKKSIFGAALLALTGSALVAGSVNIPMMIICRFLQGLGLGMLLTFAPIYISEVSPAYQRGLLVGAFAVALGAGTNLVSWISFGTFYSKNKDLQWRLPLGLACVTPLFMCIGVFFIPESPRWLVWKDRSEEAWTIIKKLHHDPADPEDTAPRAEYMQILKQV